MALDDAALRRVAERSGAIAGLARTVQHDINNLLTVVFANLEMLKRTAAEGAPQRQLGRIEEAARRFEGTSRSILSLIRRPAGEIVEISLSDTLKALRPLLHMILPAPGALVLELAEGDPVLRFERSALEEGLLALAQQIAERQPRGLALTLAVAERADAGVLEIRPAPGLAPAALDALAEVARASGGAAEAEAEALRLILPPRPKAA